MLATTLDRVISELVAIEPDLNGRTYEVVSEQVRALAALRDSAPADPVAEVRKQGTTKGAQTMSTRLSPMQTAVMEEIAKATALGMAGEHFQGRWHRSAIALRRRGLVACGYGGWRFTELGRVVFQATHPEPPATFAEHAHRRCGMIA